jgi:hypothetical protein
MKTEGKLSFISEPMGLGMETVMLLIEQCENLVALGVNRALAFLLFFLYIIPLITNLDPQLENTVGRFTK